MKIELALIPLIFLALAESAKPRIRYEYHELSKEESISLEYSVTGDTEFHLEFPVATRALRTTSLKITSRMYSEGPSSQAQRRLAIAVRHSFGQLQWDLEWRNGSGTEEDPPEDNSEASKIICLPKRPDDIDSDNVTIIVSTPRSESANVKFQLEVEFVDNFVAADGSWSEEKNIYPAAPYVWIYDFNSDHDSSEDVTVRVDSGDGRVCGLVSVQPLECPFADTSFEARFKGRWQTFLGTSVIGVRQTEQFREGFYVVVMIEEEGDMCGGGDNGQEEEGVDSGSEDNSTLIDALRGPREKSVRIMIAPTNVEVRGAVVAVLLFYALTCLLASALVSFQMPVEGKVVKRMKEANINRKTRERWNTALAKVSKKTGRGNSDIDAIDGVIGMDAAEDEDTAPVASVEDTTVARSRDISRDDITAELKREDTALAMKNMDEDDQESAEGRQEAGEDMPDGARYSNMVTRFIDSQETLPDLVVRLLDNEDGDSNKMTLVTRVKEVKEVIHTVIRVANDRGSGSQKRCPLASDDADAAGSIEYNGNHSADPRAFANSSLAVEVYKHHMTQVKTEAKKRRMGEHLTLNHLAVKVDETLYPDTLKMKSALYAWIIILIGIFYTLPVLQLLIQHQDTSLISGNLDLCYYNFLCKVPALGLEDFGHVFSNVSYVIGGIIFIVLSCVRMNRYKEYLRQRLNEQVAKHGGCLGISQQQKGIPEQYGIFYALGVALIMEGVLSGSYHICPTKVNFQFDTTFMYVIGVLLFLKFYQFRHPDITLNAHIVFSVIGLALFLEVLGYYVVNGFFWAIFILCYFVLLITFCILTYYNGMLSQFKASWMGMLESCREGDRGITVLRPTRKSAFYLTVFVIVMNCLVAAFIIAMRRPGISRYLLVILIFNMVVYVAYYMGMKCYLRYYEKIEEESISPLCWFYLICAVTSLFLGCVFFAKELKSSAVSPAASRDLNGECALLIFDNHDLWHFFSATGLFFIFMMVLTIEDNNMKTSWDQIRVF